MSDNANAERTPVDGSAASAGSTSAFEVGDLIEAIPPWALACGSGRYRRAVLVSVSPFVAVSEAGDMMWNTTIEPENVCRIGKALPEVFVVAMRRFHSGK
jgi:hypothetical protein